MRNSVVLALCLAGAAFSQLAGDPPYMLEPGWRPLLNGRDLSGWVGENGTSHGWVTAKAVAYDATGSPKILLAKESPGDRILNGVQGKAKNLVTADKFGDVELYLEFLIPKESNSGVYLQGLYEVQVFDSYGKASVNTSDGGAIYHRWIDNKPVGGSPPKVNASRPPGQWQSYHVWFRAPRFDTSGKKTQDARFEKVLYNGIVVQENFSVEGGTRSHMNIPEAAANPLMLQGDHGPVAYRNIYVRPLR
jgi:hypothetical protein